MRGKTKIPCCLTPARSMPHASPASPSHGTKDDDRQRSIELSQALSCHERRQLPLPPFPVLFLQVATYVAVATARTRENARDIFQAASSSFCSSLTSHPYSSSQPEYSRAKERILCRMAAGKVPAPPHACAGSFCSCLLTCLKNFIH